MHTHTLVVIVATLALVPGPADAAPPVTVPLTLVERSADSSLVRRAGQTQQFNATGYYELTTTIALGTPPQQVPLMADFGFGDLLVLGDAACVLPKAPGPCGGTPIFTPADSTSYRQSQTFNSSTDLNYAGAGMGLLNGHAATERVQLGGTVGDMRILVGESELVNPLGIDPTNLNAVNGVAGVLGLGFQYDLAKQVNPAPWRSVAAGRDEPVVGLRMVRSERQASVSEAANLTFGGVEEGAMKAGAQITYHNQVAGAQFWTLPLDGISVNGIAVPNVINTADSPAVKSLDDGVGPGTPIRMEIQLERPYIELPSDVFESVLQMIPGSMVSSSTWSVPCDTHAVILFRFGGVDYTLNNTDWIGKPLDSDGNDCTRLTIQPTLSAPWGSYTLGQASLVNYYTVFKVSPSVQIGFGQLSASAQDDVFNPRATTSSSATTRTGTADSNAGVPTAVTVPSGVPSGSSALGNGAQTGSRVPSVVHVAAAFAPSLLAL